MCRPRLLVVNHTAALGGGELALLRSVDALTEVFDLMAAVPGGGPLVDRLRALHVEVIDTRFPAARLDHRRLNQLGGALSLGRGVLAYVMALRRQLVGRTPDVIYANSLKAAVTSSLLAPALRRPWVWHLRDRLEVGYLGRLPVMALRSLAAVGPARIVANAAGTAELVPRWARRRTEVIPSPIEVGRFALVADRAQRGSSEPVTFVVVGRLTPVKGQHLVIEAFAEVARECDARLLLVGGDLTVGAVEHDRLSQQAARLGIADRVRLVGHVDAVEEILAQSDVLVSYPLHPEPFGQAVIQAMAAGVCVLSAAEGGPLEVIRHGRTGILVAPRDPGALAAAMRLVARDLPLRRRLAAAAQPVAASFDAARTLPQLVATLSAVVPRRSPPS